MCPPALSLLVFWIKPSVSFPELNLKQSNLHWLTSHLELCRIFLNDFKKFSFWIFNNGGGTISIARAHHAGELISQILAGSVVTYLVTLGSWRETSIGAMVNLPKFLGLQWRNIWTTSPPAKFRIMETQWFFQERTLLLKWKNLEISNSSWGCELKVKFKVKEFGLWLRVKKPY